MIDIKKIKERLQDTLPASRYEHTIGVAYTSAALAMRYGAPLEASLIAGLLHDCAKCYKHTELIDNCKKAGIKLSEEEIAAPQIIHAIYGAYMAEHTYGIDDHDIISSVRWHTTGHADMTLMEKIVFTADYIEPARCDAPDLDQVRSMAFEDITKTVYKISGDTLKYLKRKGLSADLNTLNCYNWIKEHKSYDI